MKKVLLFAALISASFAVNAQSPQCTAITKKGVQCKLHTTSANGLCHVHGGTSTAAKSGTGAQCSAIAKSSGQQCKHRTTSTSGLCFVHAKKETK